MFLDDVNVTEEVGESKWSPDPTHEHNFQKYIQIYEKLEVL